MNVDEPRLPDLLLEQYALGELNGAELDRVESLVRSDPGLRERLEELRRSNEEILEREPPAKIAAAIRRRMLTATADGQGPARRRYRPAASFAFPAAAAVLVLFGAVMARGLFLPPQADEIRAKSGAPGLLVYKKTASGAFALADGAPASAGDVLQIKYAAGSARYGVIVSLDGRGTVTWHLPGPGAPLQGGKAPRIDEKGAALASAYELDDAPAFERFFLLSSKSDFELSLVSGALRDLALSGQADTGALRLPAGLECKSLLVKKVSR
jgi:hypothetical protein